MRKLQHIVADTQLDFAVKVERMLDLGLEAFGLDVAIVSRIEDQVYRVEHALSRFGEFEAGSTFDLSGTYCAIVAQDDVPHLFHHVGASEIRTHPCYRAFRLESYIGASIFVDGERFGTINFSSPEPGTPFSPEDVDLLSLMAQWLGYELLREKQAAALATAKQQAEEASRAKSNFMATVSHELRTSMNGVLGVAQLLAQSELSSEQQRDVDTIVSSGRAMMTLLDDLLDLSSIETGELSLRFEPFRVDGLVQSCVDTLHSKAREKGLVLHVDARSVESMWLLGDPGRVRQILLNLISNAIKYTQTGDIRVGARWRQTDRGPLLDLAVRDTGIGIADEDQAVLFERFTRANSLYVRMRAGQGLGLSICRQLCDLMGGRISLKSKVGKGSTFYVALPLQQTEPPTLDMVLPSLVDSGDDDLTCNLSVLLAEDNLISQKITARMLRSLGCEVITVANGADAVAEVQAAYKDGRVIDVVLMDGRMPVMDGYQATRAIRALSGSAGHTPIIALTAGALDEDIERGLAAGMDAVAHKPLELAELSAVMRRVVK